MDVCSRGRVTICLKRDNAPLGDSVCHEQSVLAIRGKWLSTSSRKRGSAPGAASSQEQYNFRLASKVVPGIVPVVVLPEIVSVIITPEIISVIGVSAAIIKRTRRYHRCRPSPESWHPGAILAVISIHPHVTRSGTRGPHHRHRRGPADT